MADWLAFLKEQGIQEGPNFPAAPGQPFQVFRASNDIHATPSDQNWLTERAAAYQAAFLSAKAKYAEFLGTEVKAARAIVEPCFHLAARPPLPQHDEAARVQANDVERGLSDIDADHSGRGLLCLSHGVLLIW